MRAEEETRRQGDRETGRWARRVFVLLALWSACLLALATGCGPKAPAPTSQPAVNASPSSLALTDPCPSRLHDLCGPLLLYFATHHSLPGTLDELRKVPGFDQTIQTTCPVSGKPYLYNPDGLLETPTAFVIIADPLPSHSGTRWTISVPDTRGDALVTKIVAVPESKFHAAK